MGLGPGLGPGLGLGLGLGLARLLGVEQRAKRDGSGEAHARVGVPDEL